MLIENFTVKSPNVKYTEDFIESTYSYSNTKITSEDLGNGKSAWSVEPTAGAYTRPILSST
jgi:myo-inositol-1-phosphate synthase